MVLRCGSTEPELAIPDPLHLSQRPPIVPVYAVYVVWSFGYSTFRSTATVSLTDAVQIVGNGGRRHFANRVRAPDARRRRGKISLNDI